MMQKVSGPFFFLRISHNNFFLFLLIFLLLNKVLTAEGRSVLAFTQAQTGLSPKVQLPCVSLMCTLLESSFVICDKCITIQP